MIGRSFAPVKRATVASRGLSLWPSARLLDLVRAAYFALNPCPPGGRSNKAVVQKTYDNFDLCAEQVKRVTEFELVARRAIAEHLNDRFRTSTLSRSSIHKCQTVICGIE